MPFSKKYLKYGAVIIVLYVFLVNRIPDILPSGVMKYEVTGLTDGALLVKEYYTRLPLQIEDEYLIQKALQGSIKKGDVIQR